MFLRDALRLAMPALVLTLIAATAPATAEPGWAVSPSTGPPFNLPAQLPPDQVPGYGAYPAYMNAVLAPPPRTFARVRFTEAAVAFDATDHVASCQARYRTYSVATDSYVGSDSRLHRCVTPY